MSEKESVYADQLKKLKYLVDIVWDEIDKFEKDVDSESLVASLGLIKAQISVVSEKLYKLASE